MNKKLLALYGLKWNPFSPDLPSEALRVVPKVQTFGWRIEQSPDSDTHLKLPTKGMGGVWVDRQGGAACTPARGAGPLWAPA